MRKYVDKDKLYQKLHELGGCGAEKGTWDDGWDKAIDNAIIVLEQEETTEIVHCKDCKLWEKYENTAGSGYCHCKKYQFHYGQRMDMIFNPITGPNDYCSYAEARENDEQSKE